ncbi:signal peptidase I [Nesterenkonia sp. F]|uniref:signal peptidase I n=1 Tax=Nesterenkonia sp. F TaxID=795955 RepID=UPI000255D54B|nr:signal peptidase I [Nesterenkonia sp. F]
MSTQDPTTPEDGSGEDGESTSSHQVPAGSEGGSAGARRRRLRDRSPVAAFFVEIGVILLIAVVISFVVKTFLLRAFYIPSESMEDTLQVDDRIVVNLLAPEISEVQRGDVIVFEDTRAWSSGEVPAPETTPLQDALTFVGLMPDASEHYVVKRVIGVGGDEVACCEADGRLTVNGEPIDEPYLYPGDEPSRTEFDITVPENSVWVMGDHRRASADSRAHRQEPDHGAVPVEDVVGRSLARVWPIDRWGGGGTDRDPFADVPAAGD